MKKNMIAAFIFCGLLPLFGGENLLRNPEFASKDGIWPDHWTGAYGKTARAAYKTENGVVRISQKTATYNSGLNYYFDVTPGKSYYFSIEVKSDQLNHPAEILYSVVGENKVKLVNARSLCPRFKGPDRFRTGAGSVLSFRWDPNRTQSG